MSEVTRGDGTFDNSEHRGGIALTYATGYVSSVADTVQQYQALTVIELTRRLSA